MLRKISNEGKEIRTARQFGEAPDSEKQKIRFIPCCQVLLSFCICEGETQYL